MTIAVGRRNIAVVTAVGAAILLASASVSVSSRRGPPSKA